MMLRGEKLWLNAEDQVKIDPALWGPQGRNNSAALSEMVCLGPC